MFKQLKRISGIVLIASMVFSLLAGCGQNGSTKNETSEATISQATQAQSTEKSTEAPERKKLYFMQASWAKLDEPGFERTKKYIEDALNIDLQVSLNVDNKLNLVLASNEPLDFFSGGGLDLIKQGAVMKLNDLLDQYGPNIKSDVDPGLWKYVSDEKGDIYGVPQPSWGSNFLIQYRKDWAEKLGIDKPKTIEEFEAMLDKFKQAKLAGESTVPMYVDINDWGIGYASDMAFGGAFLKDGGFYFAHDIYGKLGHFINAPGYKDYISKLNDWYKKGYMAKDQASWQWDEQFHQRIKNGTIGVLVTWGTAFYDDCLAMAENIPGADYEYLPELKGPAGNVGTNKSNFSNAIFVNAKAQNPVDAVRLINWVIPIDNSAVTAWGVPGVDWEWAEKEKIAGSLKLATGKALKNPPEYSAALKFDGTHMIFLAGGVADIYIEMYGEASKMHALAPNPPAMDNMNELTEAMTQNKYNDLKTFIDENRTKFIYGTKPMSEWDSFIKQYKKMGGEQLDKAINDTYEKIKK